MIANRLTNGEETFIFTFSCFHHFFKTGDGGNDLRVTYSIQGNLESLAEHV